MHCHLDISKHSSGFSDVMEITCKHMGSAKKQTSSLDASLPGQSVEMYKEMEVKGRTSFPWKMSFWPLSDGACHSFSHENKAGEWRFHIRRIMAGCGYNDVWFFFLKVQLWNLRMTSSVSKKSWNSTHRSSHIRNSKTHFHQS